MEINERIAQYELQLLGGIPKVSRYWNDAEDRYVDILECSDVPQKGVRSCASIGLNCIDIGLQTGEQELRVELLGAGDIQMDSFQNIIASTAFALMESRKCCPGYIVKNIIAQYYPESEMKHVMLTDPFLWNHATSITIEDVCVAWLMIVPISDREYEFAQKYGTDELENLFEEEGIDIYTINRKSVF